MQARPRRQAAERALEGMASIREWEDAAENSRLVRRAGAILDREMQREDSRRRTSKKGARSFAPPFELVTPLDAPACGIDEGSATGEGGYLAPVAVAPCAPTLAPAPGAPGVSDGEGGDGDSVCASATVTLSTATSSTEASSTATSSTEASSTVTRSESVDTAIVSTEAGGVTWAAVGGENTDIMQYDGSSRPTDSATVEEGEHTSDEETGGDTSSEEYVSCESEEDEEGGASETASSEDEEGNLSFVDSDSEIESRGSSQYQREGPSDESSEESSDESVWTGDEENETPEQAPVQQEGGGGGE